MFFIALMEAEGREVKREKEGKKDRKTDRKTDRKVDWLSPLGALTGDQTTTWVCVLSGS